MTATVTREITISYASLSLGGTTDYLIDRFYRMRKSYEAFELVFRVVVTGGVGDSDATFATACANLEAAFRTVRTGAIVLAFNASNHVNYTEGSTAYNLATSIEKDGEDEGPDSRRSRGYICTVTGSLPADLSGHNFLRRLTWAVEWSPARQRTITIEGLYTRNGATGSFAQYDASIGARAASIITAAGGGTFEVDTERATPDDFDDETTFQIVYREVIYNQSSGVLNDTDIVRQAMTIRRSRVGPGDTPTVKRLQRIVVAYQAFLDKEQTQDLSGKWTAKIRPWLIANARTFSGSSTIALVDDSPDFGPDENRITASMEFIATTGTGLLSQTVTTRDELDRNKIVRKQWRQVGDADSYSPPKARVLSAPVTIRRTITTIQEVLGNVDPPGPATGGNAKSPNLLGIFGIGQGTALNFNGAGPAGGIFGIGNGSSLSLSFTPGALAGGGAPGGAGANGSGQNNPGPRWTAVGVPTRTSTPIRYGQDGIQFDVTRIETADVMELLDVDASGGVTGGGGGNAVGGTVSGNPRTT